MSIIDHFHRVMLDRPQLRAVKAASVKPATNSLRQFLLASAIWILAIALFAGLVALRIRNYLPN